MNILTTLFAVALLVPFNLLGEAPLNSYTNRLMKHPTKAARPLRMALPERFKYFKQALMLARQAGGMSAIGNREKQLNVYVFFSARKGLSDALSEIDTRKQTISLELYQEIKNAIAASETEMPLPKGVVFED